MTLALASCAFVLSFDALRSLAVTLGLSTSIAWLWPFAIDVAIAQATLCLLSLSRPTGPAATKATAAETASSSEVTRDEPRQEAPAREQRSRPAVAASQRNGSSIRALRVDSLESVHAAARALDTSDIERWQPFAESIVRFRELMQRWSGGGLDGR
jgi:Protein of unknown function (DUF2637)